MSDLHCFWWDVFCHSLLYSSICAVSFSVFKVFSVSLVFSSSNMMQRCDLKKKKMRGEVFDLLSGFWESRWSGIFHRFWKILNHYLKYFFCLISVSSSGIPVSMLDHFDPLGWAVLIPPHFFFSQFELFLLTYLQVFYFFYSAMSSLLRTPKRQSSSLLLCVCFA